MALNSSSIGSVITITAAKTTASGSIVTGVTQFQDVLTFSNGPPASQGSIETTTNTPGGFYRGHNHTASSRPDRTCRNCRYCGDGIRNSRGVQVGSEGCGCTSASTPSGLLWWLCEKRGGPVREDRARTCEDFSQGD